jgi:hypothetical protein
MLKELPNMRMVLTIPDAAQCVLRPPCLLSGLAAHPRVMRTSEPSHEPETTDRYASIDASKSSASLSMVCVGLDMVVDERGVSHASRRDTCTHQRMRTDEKPTHPFTGLLRPRLVARAVRPVHQAQRVDRSTRPGEARLHQTREPTPSVKRVLDALLARKCLFARDADARASPDGTV